MQGKPVGYLQNVALDLKTGLPWNKSKTLSRDLKVKAKFCRNLLLHTCDTTAYYNIIFYSTKKNVCINFNLDATSLK